MRNYLRVIGAVVVVLGIAFTPAVLGGLAAYGGRISEFLFSFPGMQNFNLLPTDFGLEIPPIVSKVAEEASPEKARRQGRDKEDVYLSGQALAKLDELDGKLKELEPAAKTFNLWLRGLLE